MNIKRKGHEFQEDRSRALTPDMIRGVPRNVPTLSRSVYQGTHPSAYKDQAETQSPLISAVQRKTTFFQQILAYTTAPVLILPAQNRTYLLIQNLSGAQVLFLGFGFEPNGTNSLGLRIGTEEAYEPYMIPQNDVYVSGDGSGNLCLLYAVA